MKAPRSAILDRVRLASRTGRIPTGLAPRGPRASPTSDSQLLERFLIEIAALSVTTHVAASAEAVRMHVTDIVGGHSVFSWDPSLLPYGLGAVLGSSVVTGASGRDQQAAADIGVTGCHGAIAETGSIAVLSGRGRPRAASLLPPTHLCIVRRGDLYATMGEFFRVREADIAGAACCTFITGPSRTADIELTLTLGVHGPAAVIVIVGP